MTFQVAFSDNFRHVGRRHLPLLLILPMKPERNLGVEIVQHERPRLFKRDIMPSRIVDRELDRNNRHTADGQRPSSHHGYP